MLKIVKLSSAMIAVTVLVGCSAKSNSAALETPYLEMTEAAQEVAFDKLIEDFKATLAESPVTKSMTEKEIKRSMELFELRGDAEKDMMYATMTFPEKVPQNRIKRVKQFIKNNHNQTVICAKPEVTALTTQGIGYQIHTVTLSGTALYKSEVCKGIKPAPKLRRTASAAR